MLKVGHVVILLLRNVVVVWSGGVVALLLRNVEGWSCSSFVKKC